MGKADLSRNKAASGGWARKKWIRLPAILLIIAGLVMAGYAAALDCIVKRAAKSATDRFEAEYQMPEQFVAARDLELPLYEGAELLEEWEDVPDTDATTLFNLPSFDGEEDPDALMVIPDIELKVSVFVPLSSSDMYKKMRVGAAYYPSSPMPGYVGNTCIAAHRTGPADYFRKLNELDPGSRINVYNSEGVFVYEVEKVYIVDKTDWSPVKQTDYSALTLTTCQAAGGVSNAKRLIVRAMLIEVGYGDHDGA
ncbi:MAG: sortase [Christensenellales bacterium]